MTNDLQLIERGRLNHVPPRESGRPLSRRDILLCDAARTVLQRSGLDPKKVGAVVMGNVVQAGNGQNRRGRRRSAVACRSAFPS